MKRGVLRNFAEFARKYLCQSLFLNKVAEHLLHRTPLDDSFSLVMFKVVKNVSTSIITEIFEKQNNVYDLRNPHEFVLRKVHRVFHWIESIFSTLILKSGT